MVMLMASIFLGKEFNVIGSKVSSAKINAVLVKSVNFSKISPAYFICVVFFGAPITSIFFGVENEDPKVLNSFFS